MCHECNGCQTNHTVRSESPRIKRTYEYMTTGHLRLALGPLFFVVTRLKLDVFPVFPCSALLSGRLRGAVHKLGTDVKSEGSSMLIE